MEVRTEEKLSLRLFDWEPEENIVTIIVKKKRYKVKLVRGDRKYTVLDVSKITH